jgi:hypothetical protein
MGQLQNFTLELPRGSLSTDLKYATFGEVPIGSLLLPHTRQLDVSSCLPATQKPSIQRLRSKASIPMLVSELEHIPRAMKLMPFGS